MWAGFSANVWLSSTDIFSISSWLCDRVFWACRSLVASDCLLSWWAGFCFPGRLVDPFSSCRTGWYSSRVTSACAYLFRCLTRFVSGVRGCLVDWARSRSGERVLWFCPPLPAVRQGRDRPAWRPFSAPPCRTRRKRRQSWVPWRVQGFSTGWLILHR